MDRNENKNLELQTTGPTISFTVARPSRPPSGGSGYSLAHIRGHSGSRKIQSRGRHLHLDNTKPLRSTCSMPGSVLNLAKHEPRCHGARFQSLSQRRAGGFPLQARPQHACGFLCFAARESCRRLPLPGSLKNSAYVEAANTSNLSAKFRQIAALY